MEAAQAESYSCRIEALYIPPAEEVRAAISTALAQDYKTSSVELLSESPDLNQWGGLLNNGFGGKNMIVDIGGEPFAHNPAYRNVCFDTSKVAEVCDMPQCYMLGAGCCHSEALSGHQGELILMADLQQSKNQSVSAQVSREDDQSCICSNYNSLYYGGLGNLHLTEGKSHGTVFHVKAKETVQNGEKSLIQTIRRGLQEKFEDKAVGMGGVFKVIKGKIRTHIQPDYSTCPDGYYDIQAEKAVKPFLKFYEGDSAMGPDLLCLTTLWSGDPTNGAMHLRSSGEHTHAVSTDRKQGGHYHGEDNNHHQQHPIVEYEGYFVLAESIARVRDAVSEAMTDKAIAAAGNRKPSIAVVGAGAMGCLFGGLLFQGGLDVVLIDTWEDHVNKINQNGLKLCGVRGDKTLKMKAFRNCKDTGHAVDVVIIQCKSTDTQAATASAQALFHDKTIAISFQNGLGNEDVMSEVLGGDHKVIGGQTLQGASVVEAGKVQIHTDLISYIGEWAGGCSDRCAILATVFSQAGLPTFEDSNMKKRKWMKAIYNCVVSPLSTLTNLTHRDIYCRDGAIDVADIIVKEALQVARKEGLEISEESKECLDKVIRSNQANKSSMCYDILNKKKSEIDFINGSIVTLAEKHGIVTPFNKSMVFFVKALESHYVNEEK